MSTYFFSYSEQHKVNDGHLEIFSKDPKTTAVILLYGCDIKHGSLLNVCNNTKVPTNYLTVLFNTGERYSSVKVEYSCLGNIWRQSVSFKNPKQCIFIK